VAYAVKGFDGEEEEDFDAAAALPHAVAPVGAQSAGCNGDAAATFSHAVAPVRAPSAAAAGICDEWRGFKKSCCCKDQVTRRDSVARRATIDNWRLAAEQGSQMTWSVTTDVAS
jgi:hypothetical protein